MSKKEVDNKNDIKEQKVVKKSSYSKKKKLRKIYLTALHTFNQLLIIQ